MYRNITKRLKFLKFLTLLIKFMMSNDIFSSPKLSNCDPSTSFVLCIRIFKHGKYMQDLKKKVVNCSQLILSLYQIVPKLTQIPIFGEGCHVLRLCTFLYRQFYRFPVFLETKKKLHLLGF